MTARATDVGSVWSDWTSLVRQRTAAVAGAAAVAGVATDLALRHGPPTISGAVLVAVAAAGLLVAARPVNRQAVALIAAAPLFGVWLVLRFTPWVLPLDVVAAAGLLALGAAYARGGSILDLSLPATVLHAMRAAANTVLAPSYLFAGGKHPGRRAAVVRGLLLAAPLVILVGALLASADAVFASAVRVRWTDVVFHLFAVSLGAWTMTSLVRLASVGEAAHIEIARPSLGRTEWTIVLGSLDVVLAGFAAARIVALTQGGRHVIATAGLTYAEYARSGFFQLALATLVALAAVLVVRSTAERADRRFLVLTEAAVALLLLVVVQAIQRLVLYERAFGLTMPRLWATAASVAIGLALVALAIAIAGVGAHRRWFWTVSGTCALAVLLAMNVVNAEALVVHRNVDRARASGHAYEFDIGELHELTDDAVPALASALPHLSPATRQAVLDRICTGDRKERSYLGYNLSRRAADAARSRVCGGTR